MTAGGALRVLYVINGLGTGGAERSIVELVDPLAVRGVQIRFAPLHDRDEGVHRERDDLDVVRIRQHDLLGRSRAVRRAAAAWPADIVHSTLFEADLAARLGRRRRVPLVCSLVNASYGGDRVASDPNVRRWKLEAARFVDMASARLVTHFHAITEAVADASVQDLHLRRNRITVIPRGRDRRRLGERSPDRRRQVREVLGLGGRPVVLNVGRQEYQKGQVDLVRAFEVVHRSLPDALLLIAGREGNASAAIRSEVAALGLDGAVRLLGHRSDVADLLVAADVFAFPSRYEGLGGAVLEAMALECAIVATDIPAIREVTAGAAGLVPVGDVAGLAAALLGALHGETRGDVGAARERFEATFSLERCADMMAAMYRKASVAGR